ncbi:TetR/AcrR family transcriptional regulator [Achromobacter arsenitoxydans]|uniref:TetR family transcriptional regulator n=1 Tax=Achromobacter arsenitoxydans SY8 TaxID=477184 RepID=H0F5B4_9BURK|nr:TetR/AcrR family transcriptional regulator [Achromobacter arsenitoxydans]EHK66428.1 TetR family transcriptional regulator [Achromobacter arsenitoxydans SY8]
MTDSADPTPRPLTHKGEARRLRLLDAATQSLLEHGYAQTSIQRIVQQAGGSAATAYQLFGNKEGLLAAVLQHELDKMQAAVFPAALPDQPVGPALHDLAVRLLTYAVQPQAVALHRLLVAECHRMPQLAASLQQAVDKQVHEPLEQCLRQACDRGELKIDDLRQAALTLGHLINGAAFQARLDGGHAGPAPASLLATCRYGVDMLLRAYAA